MKEAMAPLTASGLASGMAHGGHIHRKNYKFASTNGPTPASAIGHDPDFHLGNLGLAAYGRPTLGTTLGGCISEFTYPEGPTPSLVTGRG
jgi:hypothetical protein